MDCEFRDINEDCKNDQGIITVVKTQQGGEVRRCDNQACVALVADRAIEVNAWIEGQKTKEADRLERDYRTLKTEIDKGSYNGMTDEEKLSYLSDEENGTPVDNPIIQAVDFKSNLDTDEYLGCTENQRIILDMYATGGPTNISASFVKATLDSIIPGGTKSRTAIEALRPTKQSIADNMGERQIKKEHLERAGLL